MTSTSIFSKGKHTERPKGSDLGGTPRKGSRLLTWLRRGLIVLLALTLGAVVAVAYGTIDNRWYKVVAVEGGSMEPTIEAGDLIFISRPLTPEVGDIGVFQVDGKVVTHRIVEISEDGRYVTRGDANPSNDRWSDAEVDLVGIYVFRVPLVGRLLSGGIGAWFTDVDRASVGVSAGAYD